MKTREDVEELSVLITRSKNLVGWYGQAVLNGRMIERCACVDFWRLVANLFSSIADNCGSCQNDP